MSVEEDIGGLKADMTSVKDQTSKIFSKIDVMNSNLISHSSQTLVRLDVIEERHDALSEHVESRVDPHIRNFVKARASAAGLFVGIGTAAGFASGAIFDALKSFWKGGS
jgi:hypothetical protein